MGIIQASKASIQRGGGQSQVPLPKQYSGETWLRPAPVRISRAPSYLCPVSTARVIEQSELPWRTRKPRIAQSLVAGNADRAKASGERELAVVCPFRAVQYVRGCAWALDGGHFGGVIVERNVNGRRCSLQNGLSPIPGSPNYRARRCPMLSRSMCLPAAQTSGPQDSSTCFFPSSPSPFPPEQHATRTADRRLDSKDAADLETRPNYRRSANLYFRWARSGGLADARERPLAGFGHNRPRLAYRHFGYLEGAGSAAPTFAPCGSRRR